MDKVYYYMRERGFYYMRERGLLLHARERFTTTCERCWRCTLVRKKRLSSTRIQKKYDKAIYIIMKKIDLCIKSILWFSCADALVVAFTTTLTTHAHIHTHNTTLT